MNHVVLVLVAIILITHPYIDLELAQSIGAWNANAPIADLAALALLPLALRTPTTPLPGVRGYGLFLVAAVAGIAVGLDPAHSAHFLVRKPLFLYLVYGIGLARVVAQSVPTARTRQLILVGLGVAASISIATSLGRIVAGHSLWYAAIHGLTPNHKTLAVTLAGWLPLLLAGITGNADRRGNRLVVGLVLIAIAMSMSKTAWITTVFGLGWCWPRNRPLSRRASFAAPVLALALVFAAAAPLMLGSKTMLDAARSRHSLNQRAWMMVQQNPLVGTGAGTNTVVEMATYPHYRINGVDAHGVIQKVTSETGLVGLAGFAWFVLGTGATLRRRPEATAALGTWAALHINLLLSTETFSPTHWVPLAIAWGLAHRDQEAP